jgi:2-polyprenyl-6-hydroxyphenyl methylase / 3-demethylubiquinone-9 3-methyltransferase
MFNQQHIKKEMTMHRTEDNFNPEELQKFSLLAERWWDKDKEFRPLHQINPLRLEWIDGLAQLSGKRVLDVGCGGGILAEAMAAKGARVKGIDLAEKPLAVARLHALQCWSMCPIPHKWLKLAPAWSSQAAGCFSRH